MTAHSEAKSSEIERCDGWIHSQRQANAWSEVAQHLVGLAVDNLGNPEIEPVDQRAALAIATLVNGMVRAWHQHPCRTGESCDG